ncbi:hypothetical protein [Nocardioides sp. zg-DK7169]|uniref:hypothetical protein n=1 Tax=Nocardioides sp. zg-DK7169 TaxID=2736600 RepID=UPI001552A215|nr:hypothetical protein [Nocardioides sp. zg-DK7169]NPC95907.1 hypothetical protein [Nocardioides sp. zg-DK7169]
MKTGTTFLQSILEANREQLAEAGWLFPGERWIDQDRAVASILEAHRTRRPDAAPVEVDPSPWYAMAEEMTSHRGRGSILSMEFLSYAEPAQAEAIMSSLGDAEVHVVIAVRDARSGIPTQWQTSARAGSTVPWRNFVLAVENALDPEAEAETPAQRLFQRTQGVPRMLEVWGDLVGPRNLHVITMPPKGSDPMLLWKRFAKVVGIDHRVPKLPPHTVNPSLGHASAELLRLLNIELGPLDRATYDGVVKSQLGRRTLGPRAAVERKIVLNQRGLALAARWNQRVRDAIGESGARIVGRPGDLPVDPPGPDAPVALAHPERAEMLDAAATARDGLLDLQERWSAEIATPPGTEVVEDDHFCGAPVTSPERWAEEERPVLAAVSELADLVRECIALRETLMAKRHAEAAAAAEAAGTAPAVAGTPSAGPAGLAEQGEQA